MPIKCDKLYYYVLKSQWNQHCNTTVGQGDQRRLHIGERSSVELKEGHEWGKQRNEKILVKENQHKNME